MFSVIIKLYKKRGKIPIMTMSMDWWDYRILISDARFRCIDDSQCFNCYSADLSSREMLELADAFRGNIYQGSFSEEFITTKTVPKQEAIDSLTMCDDAKSFKFKVILQAPKDSEASQAS